MKKTSLTHDPHFQVLKVMRGEHLPIPDTFTAELRDLAKQLLSKNPKVRSAVQLYNAMHIAASLFD